MNRRIQEVLVQRANEAFVGRRHEIDMLCQSLSEAGPIVNFVHGIGGIGKTSLLQKFADQVREQGFPVIKLDCREIEPSIKGFLQALEQATGQTLNSSAEAGQRLGQLGGRVVLILDSYEVFRLMDTWLRRDFIPALTENIRVIIAGREPPVSGWQTRPGWAGLFHSMDLQPLGEEDIQGLLSSSGLPDHLIKSISRFSRGHPLALKLGAAALAERPDLRLREVASQKIVPQLIQMYMEDVPDGLTREALEAVSVVRRATQSLLGVLMPDSAPQDIYERLARLPFVTRGSDGLVVHDTVRQAIADNLRAADPSRYRWYRYLAYRKYRGELQTLVRDDIWRYTADMLYMIEEPVIREAFFPTDAQLYAVETAQASDYEDIIRITARHETAQALQLTESLLSSIPDGFRVVRNSSGKAEGYYVVFDPRSYKLDNYIFDPVLRNWTQHLKDNPIPEGQCVLFLRRWLGEVDGELPSPIQAACWIDVKGDYIRLRSTLRRVYCSAIATDIYGPVLQRLGFDLVPEAEVDLDGDLYQTAVLDFGPDLILGWLDGHLRASVEMEEDLLDYDARELVIDDRRIALTPLEFGVIAYLCDHQGKAVSRSTLLNHVWGYEYEGGSNVVDARIRDLRKKLDNYSSAIETVSGVGYRFRNPVR